MQGAGRLRPLSDSSIRTADWREQGRTDTPLVVPAAVAEARLVADPVVVGAVVVTAPAVRVATVVEAVVVTLVAGVDIREAADIPAAVALAEAVAAVAPPRAQAAVAAVGLGKPNSAEQLVGPPSPYAPRPPSCHQLVRLSPPIVRRRQ